MLHKPHCSWDKNAMRRQFLIWNVLPKMQRAILSRHAFIICWRKFITNKTIPKRPTRHCNSAWKKVHPLNLPLMHASCKPKRWQDNAAWGTRWLENWSVWHAPIIIKTIWTKCIMPLVTYTWRKLTRLQQLLPTKKDAKRVHAMDWKKGYSCSVWARCIGHNTVLTRHSRATRKR